MMSGHQIENRTNEVLINKFHLNPTMQIINQNDRKHLFIGPVDRIKMPISRFGHRRLYIVLAIAICLLCADGTVRSNSNRMEDRVVEHLFIYISGYWLAAENRKTIQRIDR